MEYVNRASGVRITLDGLEEAQRTFYLQARKLFRRNTPWLAFDEFVFSMNSPLFKRRRSHLDVLKDPLFLALEDMSLTLGVRQGLIASEKAAAGTRRAALKDAQRRKA